MNMSEEHEQNNTEIDRDRDRDRIEDIEIMRSIRVLIACEFSGVVRDAFRRRGFDAVSCDLLPSDSPDGPHIQTDVLNIINAGWDIMIAFPPCTYLANSGVRWLHEQKDRWKKMRSGAEFFRQLLEADIPHIAVENPIMHKYAVEIIGRRQDQCVQPWMFGHGETKATCFWLKNLPKLRPTHIVNGRVPRVHYESPGHDRWKKRSITYRGLAEAMAQQWGEYIVQHSKE